MSEPPSGHARDLAWPLIKALSGTAELVQQRSEAHPEDQGTIKLLGLLAEHGPRRPSDISVHLGLSPAAVTRRIRVLEAAGELTAVADPDDARAYTVGLTDAGRHHLDTFVADLSARVGAALTDWDDSDIVALTTLLNRLTSQATEHQPMEAPASQPHDRHWWLGR